MYFVCKQHQEFSRTYENNVRLGGFKTVKGAMNAAVRHAPAIVRTDKREIVGQTIDGALPFFINKARD